MKMLRIPAIFLFLRTFLCCRVFFFRIFKQKSYRVPAFVYLLQWRDLVEYSTGRILGLCQESLKSQKVMDKLYSPCFLIQTLFVFIYL